MFCTNCGASMEKEQLFCSECGTKKLNAQESTHNGSTWYYIDDGTVCGPHEINVIATNIRNGSIARSTLVWQEGLRDWIPAEHTILTSMLKPVIPSIPEKAMDNRFVWALASVPIFVSWILEGMFGYSDSIIFVVVILNIIFLSLDIKTIEKTGKKPEGWVWLGLVLVPIYLFLRASKTDQKYAYAFLWCGMYLIDLL